MGNFHCFRNVAMNHDKLEALRYHASRGRYLKVKSLVKAGVDLDGKDSDGRTAVMLAVEGSDRQFVDLLIRIGRTNHDTHAMSPLAEGSHRKVVDLLIKSGADIHCCDAYGWTLLHYVSVLGWVETIQCLVNKGVAIDVKEKCGRTPMMMAVQCSHTEVVELLLNSGADIHTCDEFGWSLLHHASYEGSMELVQFLVNKGIALDTKDCYGETPLMMVSKWPRTEIFKVLINCGADIHCIDNTGETVLHHASMGGIVEIVQCLLSKGLSPDVRRSDGETPAMIAIRFSNVEVVELLIKSGADQHCCDKNGWTVLHHASGWGSVSTVQPLLKDVDINIKTSDGKTALHCSIKTLRLDNTGYLLKAGADCNLEDNNGESAFSFLIREIRDFETIKLCIAKGAYVKSTDYNRLLKDPLLKQFILQNAKLCSQAVINKFNNKDLPLLYKRVASAQKLPHIDKMKIENNSGMGLDVHRSVTDEIQANGFCNLLELIPLVLGMLCVKSFIEESRISLNQENPSEPQ